MGEYSVGPHKWLIDADKCMTGIMHARLMFACIHSCMHAYMHAHHSWPQPQDSCRKGTCLCCHISLRIITEVGGRHLCGNFLLPLVNCTRTNSHCHPTQCLRKV